MFDFDESEYEDEDDESLIVAFAQLAADPANALIEPGQVEAEGRMALGDERFEMVRNYNDAVAISQLQSQQATAQFIFAQARVHSAIAGAVRGATIVVLAASPFLVLRLFRR